MNAEQLLPLLLCPISRGRLLWLPEQQLLHSPRAGVAYPVRNGVPVLLVEEALPWPEAG